MSRLIVLLLMTFLVFAMGCAHGVWMPERNSKGGGSYSGDVPELRKATVRYIPESLLSREFFSPAVACAVAHNRADDVGRSCGVTEGFLTAGQLTSAGIIALSAGVSGRVENDVARRHWEYAGLGAAAALAALAGFDAWLNCSERTWVQKELAAEQLAKLQNAGRLATCGDQHKTYEESIKKVTAALDTIKQRAAEVKAAKAAAPPAVPPGGPPLADESEILKGVADLEKALANANATADDVRVTAAKVEAPMTAVNPVQEQAAIDAERAKVGRAGREAAPLKATLCRDVEKTTAGENRALSSRDYMDAAHRELVECLTPRSTRFSATTVGANSPQ